MGKLDPNVRGMTKEEILQLAKDAHRRGDRAYRDVLLAIARKMKGGERAR